MDQIEITKAISTRYTMETLKSASEEVEVYGGDIMEVPKEEYVEWLEMQLYKFIEVSDER